MVQGLPGEQLTSERVVVVAGASLPDFSSVPEPWVSERSAPFSLARFESLFAEAPNISRVELAYTVGPGCKDE